MQIKSLFSKNVFLAVKPFSALKESFREGYGKQKLIKDIIAGLTVGVIAIPLSMALAIASGVPPQHGLYTAIVAGGVGWVTQRISFQYFRSNCSICRDFISRHPTIWAQRITYGYPTFGDYFSHHGLVSIGATN